MGIFDFINRKAYKAVNHMVVEWQMAVNELAVLLQLSYPPSSRVGEYVLYRNYLMGALVCAALIKNSDNAKFKKLLFEVLEADDKANVWQGSIRGCLASVMKLYSTIIHDETTENSQRTKEAMDRNKCSLEDALLWRTYRTLMMALTDVENVDDAADRIQQGFHYPLNLIPPNL